MKAHELLSTSDKWTTGAYSVDKDDSAFGIYDTHISPEAVKFCTVGALIRCYGYESPAYFDKRNLLENKLFDDTGCNDVTSWNDNSTYEEVHRVLKELDI